MSDKRFDKLESLLLTLADDFNSHRKEFKALVERVDALQRSLGEVQAELEVPRDPAGRLESEFLPRAVRDDQFSSRSTPSAASFDGRGKRSRPNSSYFDDY